MEPAAKEPYRILFVCVHNAARSQMAEGFLNQLGGERFRAESAGLEPGVINPIVVELMQEKGIDLSQKGTRDVQAVFKSGARFDAVITVCDEAQSEKCPVFPGMKKNLRWSFEDPSTFGAGRPEAWNRTRMVRDQIEKKVREFIQRSLEPGFWDTPVGDRPGPGSLQ